MSFKSQKGFTGADVTVAILIITVFAGIIASLYQNYAMSSKQIERQAEATNYAVTEIEEIKENAQEYFSGSNEKKDIISVYNNDEIGKSGYSRTVTLTDYAATNEKEGAEFRLCKNSKCNCKL